MGKPNADYSILVPAHNEAEHIARSLDNLAPQMHDSGHAGEVIIVPNGCVDATTEVAAAWAERNPDVRTTIIETDKSGKLVALNIGLSACTGEIALVMDGDATIDDGGLAWVLGALDDSDTKLSSLCHALMPGSLPDDEKLAVVEKMNELWRLSYPERFRAHGAFMGWKRELIDSFPEETSVPDDTWISLHTVHEHGLQAIKVANDPYSRYIPPQNWEEYYHQQQRYLSSEELVYHFFPEYRQAGDEITRYMSSAYPLDVITSRWKERCIQEGIDFDAELPLYMDVLAKVRAGKDASLQEHIAHGRGGRWQRLDSTKHLDLP